MSRNCQYKINSKRGDSKTVPMVTSEVTAEQRLCDAQEFRRWIRTVRRAHDGHSQLDGLGIIYLTQVAAVALNSWISAHSSVARSMRQAAADQPRADSTFRPTSSRTHQPPPSSSTVHSCGRACPLRRGSTRGPRPRSSAGLPARAPAHTADGTGVTRKNCASSVRSRVVDGSCQRDLRACNRNDPPECLDWMIPMSEAHLRSILRVWRTHYNGGRPHSALRPGVPGPPEASVPIQLTESRHRLAAGALVLAKSVLGGLHHEYSIAATPATA